MSAFHNSRFKNKPWSQQTLLMSIRVYYCNVLQQASLLANNPRSTRISIHFHTNVCVLIPDVTLCDVRNRNVLKPL